MTDAPITRGPVRPMYISAIRISFPPVDSFDVIPVDKPTVPMADTVSYA